MDSSEHIVKSVMHYLPQAQNMNLAEILALTKNQGQEGGAFGGGQGMFFLLFLLLLLGRNGQNGLFGGGASDSAALTSQLTQNGITRADLQVIIEQLNSISTGQNTGFAQQVQVMTQGFAGLNTQINQSQFNITQELNGLAARLATCCCEIERGIDGVNRNIDAQACSIKETINGAYNALTAQATNNQYATNQHFCELKYQGAIDKAEIIRAVQDGNTAIINKLNSDRYETLSSENAALKLAISQEKQTSELIAALKKGAS